MLDLCKGLLPISASSFPTLFPPFTTKMSFSLKAYGINAMLPFVYGSLCFERRPNTHFPLTLPPHDMIKDFFHFNLSRSHRLHISIDHLSKHAYGEFCFHLYSEIGMHLQIPILAFDKRQPIFHNINRTHVPVLPRYQIKYGAKQNPMY